MTLTVNPEKKSISVNVTGPSETRGILNVFIPDDLLLEYNSSISKMLFTIDNLPFTPSITRMTNGYLITLTYNHSQRVINIYYVTYNIMIKALDYAGIPISTNAIVNVSGPIEASATFNSSGIATLTKVPAGNYIFKVYDVSYAGEGEILITGSEQITVQTEVGKLLAEHEQLQGMFQKLTQEFEDLNSRSLILLTSTIALLIGIVGLSFYIIKLKTRLGNKK